MASAACRCRPRSRRAASSIVRYVARPSGFVTARGARRHDAMARRAPAGRGAPQSRNSSLRVRSRSSSWRLRGLKTKCHSAQQRAVADGEHEEAADRLEHGRDGERRHPVHANTPRRRPRRRRPVGSPRGQPGRTGRPGGPEPRARVPRRGTGTAARAGARSRSRATIVLAAVFTYLAVRGVNWHSAWHALEHCDAWWLVPAMAAFAVQTVMRAMRWRSLFAHGRRPAARPDPRRDDDRLPLQQHHAGARRRGRARRGARPSAPGRRRPRSSAPPSSSAPTTSSRS